MQDCNASTCTKKICPSLRIFQKDKKDEGQIEKMAETEMK